MTRWAIGGLLLLGFGAVSACTAVIGADELEYPVTPVVHVSGDSCMRLYKDESSGCIKSCETVELDLESSASVGVTSQVWSFEIGPVVKVVDGPAEPSSPDASAEFEFIACGAEAEALEQEFGGVLALEKLSTTQLVTVNWTPNGDSSLTQSVQHKVDVHGAGVGGATRCSVGPNKCK